MNIKIQQGLILGVLVLVFTICQRLEITNAGQQQIGIFNESATEFIKRIESIEVKNNTYDVLAGDLYIKLKNNNYLDVEKYFDELIKTKIKGEDGVYLIYHVYEKLTSNYLDSGFDVFDRWCKSSNHHSAFMTRAGYYINDGWQDRGHGYSSTVSPEQFKLFHEKLSIAYDDLTKAYELSQTNPIIPMAMLKLARGNSLAKQQLNKWYRIGVNIDPSFYWIYKQYFNAMLPKWGGIPGESQDFVLKINNNPPPGSLVYTLVFDQIKDQIRRKKYRLNKSEFDNFFSELERIVVQYSIDVPNSNKYKINLLELKGWCNINKDLKEAENNFKDALELDPKYDLAWYGLGDVYSQQGKNQKDAILFYNKAIEMNPDEAWYYPNRANVASNLGLLDQCIADYSFAIDNGYGRISTYYHSRGWCFKKKGDKKNLQLAINDFSRAIELKQSAYTYSSRGDIYSKLEMYQNAIQDYSEAIKLKGDQYFFYSNRANIYVKIGDFEKAVNDAQKVLSMKPNDSKAKSIIANYQKH